MPLYWSKMEGDLDKGIAISNSRGGKYARKSFPLQVT